MRIEYIINKLIKDVTLAQISLENNHLYTKKSKK